MNNIAKARSEPPLSSIYNTYGSATAGNAISYNLNNFYSTVSPHSDQIKASETIDTFFNGTV
jgi:hypothetical protein